VLGLVVRWSLDERVEHLGLGILTGVAAKAETRFHHFFMVMEGLLLRFEVQLN
jgi:hypothetical protein